MGIPNVIRLAQRTAARAVGGEATLTRGGKRTYRVPVVWGRTEARFENFDGKFQTVRSRDAIVEQSKYCIDDVPTPPRPGDRLAEPVDDEFAVWEVQPFADDAPATENDPHHVCWRVHLKELGRVKPGAENTLRSLLEVPAAADDDFGTDDALQAADELRIIERD